MQHNALTQQPNQDHNTYCFNGIHCYRARQQLPAYVLELVLLSVFLVCLTRYVYATNTQRSQTPDFVTTMQAPRQCTSTGQAVYYRNAFPVHIALQRCISQTR